MLGKDKLNSIEFLISKALIDSYISHDKFVSVNNALRVLWNERNEKSWNFFEINYIKIVDISKKMYERNGIEKVDNNEILWLNEKHIEGLHHKNLWEIRIKYYSNHRKHGTRKLCPPPPPPSELSPIKSPLT